MFLPTHRLIGIGLEGDERERERNAYTHTYHAANKWESWERNKPVKHERGKKKLVE